MNKKERMVFFYDMDISASSRTFEAPKPISVRKAFELMGLVPLEQKIKKMDKATLYISNWELDQANDIIKILINKSDQDTADPIYSDLNTKQRRVISKEKDEGQDFSVHIIVKLSKEEKSPATVLVEYCSGLGFSNITKLLNTILKKSKDYSPNDFTQNHPDGSTDRHGNQRKYNVSFKFNIEGHISEELKNDLNKGKIQSVELITDVKRENNFDEEGRFIKKTESVTLKTKNEDYNFGDKIQRIVDIFKNEENKYDKAKVKFKTESGISRTFDICCNEAHNFIYVRKEKINNFTTELQSSYHDFNQEILQKMERLL